MNEFAFPTKLKLHHHRKISKITTIHRPLSPSCRPLSNSQRLITQRVHRVLEIFKTPHPPVVNQHQLDAAIRRSPSRGVPYYGGCLTPITWSTLLVYTQHQQTHITVANRRISENGAMHDPQDVKKVWIKSV